ncbi:hypothetical protein T265_09838 [Opisthorchis viverrini]|uniref:Folate receptor-like domain-containing protein n=1 Tax=Opisthorchis viverrini TaxID=6198 RepID=A0A074ZFF7_OPIVI|nr:hypothetical protein T265_09838 [Opisthorchis viverrini]KER21970.1 hypothetical protein T265_09838 [Opisthorchis viverrini]
MPLGNTMVAHSLLTVLLIMAANAYDNRLNEIRSVDDYLNICMNGTHHKKAPSPEPTDDHICTDWASMSCCEHKTMRSVQESLLYNFNHSHCKPMSPKCMDMFKRELCFYECSPHVGPWLVKTRSRRRMERSYHVPLCEEDCNMWYEACKIEETCVRDWSVEFEWSKGMNVCPSTSACELFSDVYKNASDFCHAIWDGGWKVEKAPRCMHFVAVDERSKEHNQRVARQAAEEIIRRLSGTSSAYSQFSGLVFLLSSTIPLVFGTRY